MLFTTKNKTMMALDRLIESAMKHQYIIPDEIELDPSELFQLMSEIEVHEKKSDIRKEFKVSSEDNSANIFDFFALKRDFVDKWNKRLYTVTYRGNKLQLYANVRKPL